MGFQTSVKLQPAPAVEGDFASTNPRASVLAGESQIVAGASGVTVGKFAWLDAAGNKAYSYGQIGQAPNGFVARTHQALITNYRRQDHYEISHDTHRSRGK